MISTRFALAALLPLTLVAAEDAKPKAAGDMPLVFEETFEKGDLSRWEFTDPAAWKLDEVEGNKVLNQFKASKYQAAVRSPFNIAWAKGVNVSDFVLDLKVKSTARDYGHRDMCLFFGKQSPTRFYYVHFGKEADPHAHSIFLVNDKPRVSIAEDRTKGTPWTNGVHHLRVVRKVADGLIQVYFDDMDKPVMTAHDKSFSSGPIGVGTFDDTGMFDDIRVWGNPASGK